MLNFYYEQLKNLKSEMQFRTVKDIIQDGKYVVFNGRRLLNLSSNDYLGISADENIKDNFLSHYKGKIQNPSARLLTGTNRIFFELEDLIKSLTNKEKVLLFNSGYHANVGIFSALLTREDVVFIDRLNHASIIDGVRLSGAKVIPFSHTDYDDLEEKLKKYRGNFKKSIISTESLFSMDGDFADISKLAELKEKHNSILVVDEAHSFGVFGGGRGYCFERGVRDVDIIMGTFGKAVGSYGAFAAGKKVLIEYLTNFARPFIFSTMFPEISAAFSKYAIENHILNGNLQEKLFKITKYVHRKIDTCGESYILPVVAGENDCAVKLSEKLIEEGYYALPIRYPTVKKNTARVRISLNSAINEAEVSRLVNFLQAGSLNCHFK